MKLADLDENLFLRIVDFIILPELLSFYETCRHIMETMNKCHNIIQKSYMKYLRMEILIFKGHFGKSKISKSEQKAKSFMSNLIISWKLYCNMHYEKMKIDLKNEYEKCIGNNIYTESKLALKKGSKMAYLRGQMSLCSHDNVCLLYQSTLYMPPNFHQETILHTLCSHCQNQCLSHVWICTSCSYTTHYTTQNSTVNPNYSKETITSPSPPHYEVYCSQACVQLSRHHYRHPIRKLTFNTTTTASYECPKKFICCCFDCGLPVFVTLTLATKSKGIQTGTTQMIQENLEGMLLKEGTTSSDTYLNKNRNKNSNTSNISSSSQQLQLAAARNSNNSNSQLQKNNQYNHNTTLNSSNKILQQPSSSNKINKLVNVEFTCVCYQSHLRMKLQSAISRQDIIEHLTDRDFVFTSRS